MENFYTNIFSIQYFNILMVVSSIMSSVHFHFATVEQQSWDVSMVLILVSGDRHCYTAQLANLAIFVQWVYWVYVFCQNTCPKWAHCAMHEQV